MARFNIEQSTSRSTGPGVNTNKMDEFRHRYTKGCGAFIIIIIIIIITSHFKSPFFFIFFIIYFLCTGITVNIGVVLLHYSQVFFFYMMLQDFFVCVFFYGIFLFNNTYIYVWVDFFIFQISVITSHHGRGIIRAPKENKKPAEKGKRKKKKGGERKRKREKTTPAALFFFLHSHVRFIGIEFAS